MSASPDSEIPEPTQTPPSLVLLVVRHGVTAWNAEGRLQGQTDIPLSPDGQRQALSLGRRCAAAWVEQPSYLPGPPVAVYTSDLSRARETAELLLATVRERLPSFDPAVHVTPLLRERNFGVWEGLTAAEARERFGSERSYRVEGEPQAAVRARMNSALDLIRSQVSDEDTDRVVLVVGHGGSLRQLVCATCGFDLNQARRFHLDNTGLSVLQFAAGLPSATIRLWNDTAHLTYDC